MGVPKRKTSKSRQRSRRMANRFHAPELVECPNCGAQARPHRVCPSCGHLNGKQIVTVEVA